MEQKQGIKNFAVNIKPIMEKCRHGKKLTKQEQETIVQFYLEVVDFISKEVK